MKNSFDFHVHSTASDGSLSPSDVVRKAAADQVTVVALTDHDTTEGVKEFVEAGKECGITAIGGVEISIDYPGTMHMCGYFVDVDNDELRSGLQFVQEARLNRNPMIVEKLNAAGVDITMEEIVKVAGGGQVGRPHFAEVMVRKGFVSNTKEAFTKYMAKGKPCYVDKKRLGLKEAVAMIRSAGGIAVLAHPGELRLNGQGEYEEIFKRIKDEGVEGLESYSSHHTDEQNAQFRELADKFDLFSTAGSDFHGDTKPHVQLGVFGEQVEVDVSSLIETMNWIRTERCKL